MNASNSAGVLLAVVGNPPFFHFGLIAASGVRASTLRVGFFSAAANRPAAATRATQVELSSSPGRSAAGGRGGTWGRMAGGRLLYLASARYCPAWISGKLDPVLSRAKAPFPASTA